MSYLCLSGSVGMLMTEEFLGGPQCFLEIEYRRRKAEIKFDSLPAEDTG